MPSRIPLGLAPSTPDDFRYHFRKALEEGDVPSASLIVNRPEVDTTLTGEFLQRAMQHSDKSVARKILESGKLTPIALWQAIRSGPKPSTPMSRPILRLLLNEAERQLNMLTGRPAVRMMNLTRFYEDAQDGLYLTPRLSGQMKLFMLLGLTYGLVKCAYGNLSGKAACYIAAAELIACAIVLRDCQLEGRRARLESALEKAVGDLPKRVTGGGPNCQP
jgi:hypothetical protein